MTTIKFTADEIADYINKKGVHYEYCSCDSDMDRDFVDNLDDLDPAYIDMNQAEDSGYTDLHDIASFVVESAYLNQTEYDFKQPTSIIALNI